MSKRGRGILRGPGPYSCPYSPECVEYAFCEVRECAYSPSVCSSVFTPQCAGG
jgi:hypothetical protein